MTKRNPSLSREAIKDAENKFLYHFPNLKKNLEQHANELVLVHRLDTETLSTGDEDDDNSPLEICRFPSHYDSGMPETYLGVIKKPYFKFQEDSIWNLPMSYSGIITVDKLVQFRGENPRVEVRDLFEKLKGNLPIFTRDAMKKEYEVHDGRTGKTHYRQVREFTLAIGDDAVENFIMKNNVMQGSDIFAYLKRKTTLFVMPMDVPKKGSRILRI